MIRGIGIILDSSFIYALYAEGDRYHGEAVKFIEDFNGVTFVPEITLPEVVFLFRRAGGIDYAIRFLKAFNSAQDELECTTAADLIRAQHIMSQYHDAKLDLVDCCITAIAERLHTPRIATYDRRDFGMIVPRNADYFELLP